MNNQADFALFIIFPVIALIASCFSPALVPARRTETARTVIDARGKAVELQLPYRGSVIYSGIAMPDYLLVTQSPETLLDTFSFGGTRTSHSLLPKIYPQLSKVPVLVFERAQSIETMLLQKPSAVFTWTFETSQLERFGLPALGLKTASEADALKRTAIYADALGKTQRGQDVVQSYGERFQALAAELRPEQITNKKRVLMLNRNGGIISTPNGHSMVWRRAGLREAYPFPAMRGTVNFETVLNIDPDILLLSGNLTPQEILSQPEWRLLRAVRNNSMYALLPGIAGQAWNIVDLPFYARWLAELAYPERLPSSLRCLMRETYRDELDYEASDADLDEALGMEQNEGSRGYKAFAAESSRLKQ